MEKNEYVIRPATPADWERVSGLLAGFDLPTEDVDPSLNHFIVACRGSEIVGCIGVEIYEQHGLLRSLAVDESVRNEGWGKLLCSRLIESAAEKGVCRLHLLTNTAEFFFKKFGFKTVGRDTAPDVIQSTREFSHLCPSSAIYMTKDIRLRSEADG